MCTVWGKKKESEWAKSGCEMRWFPIEIQKKKILPLFNERNGQNHCGYEGRLWWSFLKHFFVLKLWLIFYKQILLFFSPLEGQQAKWSKHSKKTVSMTFTFDHTLLSLTCFSLICSLFSLCSVFRIMKPCCNPFQFCNKMLHGMAAWHLPHTGMPEFSIPTSSSWIRPPANTYTGKQQWGLE